MNLTRPQLERWKADPAAFVREALRNPETEQPFTLYPEQETFLRIAFALTPDGRLKYPLLVFAAPKKSGKTTFAAIIQLYVIIVLGGRFAEGYCAANDLDQSQGRVFQAIVRIIEASPHLRDSATITASKITFPATGATITAIASDYAGAAGANPTITTFDELWAYTSERSHRLWDEMVPPPTRKIACRLVVTYAGFEGESKLLEDLHKKAVTGTQITPDLYEAPGMLCYWTHEAKAPWQTLAWLASMREQLRPNAFIRMITNRFVTTESTFVEMAWWDGCTDPAQRPRLADPSLVVWIGVDASVKHDSTAIVACTFDPVTKKVRLVWHRVFQPSPDAPLDFEATIEETLLTLRSRFCVRAVRYDPYQMASIAQRLTAAGLSMVEFPQSVPNLTAASQNLYELVKGQNLTVYPDDDLRLAVSRAVAIETTRGWRLTKEKASHKIDVVVALAMAALGAVEGQGQVMPIDLVNGVMLVPSQNPFAKEVLEQREVEQFTREWHSDRGLAPPQRWEW